MRHALPSCLALAVLLAASGGPQAAPAPAAGAELRDLTAAVERLVALLDAEVRERRGTESLRQLAELDKMVAAVEANLRARRDARDEAAAALREIEAGIAETRRTLDAVDGQTDPNSMASLIASAGGTLTAERLEVALDDARAQAEQARARLNRIDQEIADLGATLDARRRLRDEVEERTEALVRADR